MTRIFTDGAEFGDILFFDGLATLAASTTQKRSGAYSYYIIQTYGTKNITGISEFYLRFGLYIVSNTTITQLVRWRNSTTDLGGIRHDGDINKLKFYTSTSTLVSTGGITVSTGSWYLIEVHVKIADSGNLDLRVDGVTDISAAFAGDTKPGAATTADNLLFGSTTGGSLYIDDLALNNIADGVDDSWCGEGKIIFLSPNANGDNSEFTNSSGTSTNNYTFVDEIPSDSDVSYVQASVSGTLDLYNLSACGLTDVTINRVWAEARAKDTVAEGGQIFLAVKTEGTEYDSSAINLLTTYAPCIGTVHTVNPNTSIAWTTTQLDALQVGPKVI